MYVCPFILLLVSLINLLILYMPIFGPLPLLVMPGLNIILFCLMISLIFSGLFPLNLNRMLTPLFHNSPIIYKLNLNARLNLSNVIWAVNLTTILFLNTVHPMACYFASHALIHPLKMGKLNVLFALFTTLLVPLLFMHLYLLGFMPSIQQLTFIILYPLNFLITIHRLLFCIIKLLHITIFALLDVCASLISFLLHPTNWLLAPHLASSWVIPKTIMAIYAWRYPVENFSFPIMSPLSKIFFHMPN